MTTTVIHVNNMSDGDVYIGRPSWRLIGRHIWGNPFIIGRDGTREEVITKYETWIQTQPDRSSSLPPVAGRRLRRAP